MDRNSTGDIYLFKPELWKAMIHSPPWRDSATRNCGEMQEREGATDMKFPPEVSPTCACWGLTEEKWRRGCSSIFWGHIKICSMGSHWPGVLQEVVAMFYYQHLKRCRSPQASLMCSPHLCFSSLWCLLMTRMPVCNSLNNYRQDREEETSEWWNVDFIITCTHQCRWRMHVSL